MDLQSALNYVDQHGPAMLSAPGSDILAVAVSTKEGGPITAARDFTVTAYVERKLANKELKRQSVQPFDHVFAEATGVARPRAVDIDIVEAGSEFTLNAGQGLQVPAIQRGAHGGPPPVVDSQKYFNALMRGIGITNPEAEYPGVLSVGTLGFFVRDSNGIVHLVSNNHVIGKSANRSAVAGVLGNRVVQPGTLDLTEGELAGFPTLANLVTQYQIATVSGIVPLQFQTPRTIPVNRVDAACARLDLPNPRSILQIDRACFGGCISGTHTYQTDPNDPNRVLGDSRVYKVGRTTGYTEGTVTAIAGTASLTYPGGTAFFKGQIVISATTDNVGPFSNSGDSGSGVLTAQHSLIGLLFAGSTLQTLVNPIADVLSGLQTALGAAGLVVL